MRVVYLCEGSVLLSGTITKYSILVSGIITKDSILVIFDVVNMFPNINNISGMKVVSDILKYTSEHIPSDNCILEALKICLESNISNFNNLFYLQEDGTVQGPHMSCSYSDIAMYPYDHMFLVLYAGNDFGVTYLLYGIMLLKN